MEKGLYRAARNINLTATCCRCQFALWAPVYEAAAAIRAGKVANVRMLQNETYAS